MNDVTRKVRRIITDFILDKEEFATKRKHPSLQGNELRLNGVDLAMIRKIDTHAGRLAAALDMEDDVDRWEALAELAASRMHTLRVQGHGK